MKKVLFIVIPLILITAAATAVAVIHMKTPSREFKSYENNSDILLAYNGKPFEEAVPITYKDSIYIPFNFVSRFISDDIFIETEHDLISVFFDARLSRITAGEMIYMLEDQKYIKLDFLIGYFPLSVYIYDDFVLIFDQRAGYEYVTALDKTYIRHEPKIKSPYMEYAQTDDILYIISQKEDWVEVLSKKGSIGYARTDTLSEINIQDAVYEEINWEGTRLDGMVSFGWEMMYSIPDDPDSINIYQGLDAVSPTWISLVDKSGNITHRIVPEYTARLKESGIYVIPCVTNAFDDPGMTSDFLTDPYARDSFILSLKEICLEYGFDGINIDFENIRYANKNHFTQFIRELSYEFAKEGLVLSVCTGVMGGSLNYSLVYDQKKIGEFADYIMVMSYDELPYSGGEYGPVASLGWQEKKLKEIISLVPSEKVFLGIPLYTRVWNMNDEGSYSSIPISILRQEEIISENEDGVFDIDPKYDQKTFRYYKNETDYLMYIERRELLEARWRLIEDLGLAGAAYWAINYVRSDYFSYPWQQ